MNSEVERLGWGWRNKSCRTFTRMMLFLYRYVENLTAKTASRDSSADKPKNCALLLKHEISIAGSASAYHKVYFQMWMEVRFDFRGLLEVKSNMADG